MIDKGWIWLFPEEVDGPVDIFSLFFIVTLSRGRIAWLYLHAGARFIPCTSDGL